MMMVAMADKSTDWSVSIWQPERIPQAVVSGCWRLLSVAGKTIAKSSIINADRPVTTTCRYGKTYVLQLVKKTASL